MLLIELYNVYWTEIWLPKEFSEVNTDEWPIPVKNATLANALEPCRSFCSIKVSIQSPRQKDRNAVEKSSQKVHFTFVSLEAGVMVMQTVLHMKHVLDLQHSTLPWGRAARRLGSSFPFANSSV